MLLLIACLASFVLRLIGSAGIHKQLELQFQSNTRRTRPVLSVITLARQIVRRGQLTFSRHELKTALDRLRYDHPALEF